MEEREEEGEGKVEEEMEREKEETLWAFGERRKGRREEKGCRERKEKSGLLMRCSGEKEEGEEECESGENVRALPFGEGVEENEKRSKQERRVDQSVCHSVVSAM